MLQPKSKHHLKLILVVTTDFLETQIPIRKTKTSKQSVFNKNTKIIFAGVLMF
jgi:hypothetical protein